MSLLVLTSPSYILTWYVKLLPLTDILVGMVDRQKDVTEGVGQVVLTIQRSGDLANFGGGSLLLHCRR